MDKKKKKTIERRVLRVRKKLKGKKDRPRLSIFKSNKNIYAQIIDDEKQITLVSVGSFSEKKMKLKDIASMLGKKLAKLAKEKKIKRVVFDRGRYKYHGIITVFAEAARNEGLQF
ncbi:MAG: hypothetical protein AMS24_01260 [Chlamydiae bacterium SM23_39]|nr:MAG: hypothetical protein AMS24_01260 [Chlamydiae bacterium SM23_39]